MQRPIRLGLVGAGRWGRNYIRTIAAVPSASLIAVASRNAATDQLLPAACSRVEDWRILLDAGRIDGLVLAIPPNLHLTLIEEATAAGLPVLVEKPLVICAGAADRLRKLRVTQNVRVMVDHTHLFHPAFIALKQLAPSFGPVRAIRASAGARGPYRSQWPVLWDWGPHDVSMCLDLIPGSAQVEAAQILDADVTDGVLAERINLVLQLSGGVRADLVCSTLDERHRWFAVDFEEATLVYGEHPAGPLVKIAPGGGDPRKDFGQSIGVPSGPLPLTRAVEIFVEMIAKDCFDDTSFSLGLAVVDCLAICEGAMSSWKNNLHGC